jgi:putative two-component system response regulator
MLPEYARAPRILVADDDAAMRALLRATLTRAGYGVEEVDNGTDVLVCLSRSLPDLLLLDVGMPGMDGLQVTRALRLRRELSLMPIILVTARGRVEDKVAGLDAGATDFITKPFEPAELLARVRAGLRLADAIEHLEQVQDVLVTLANAVEAKDPITEHHCNRVAERAVALARQVGQTDEEVEAVGYGAVLHDVGKIGIAEAVLLKEGPLTEAERAEMQRHPLIGAGILEPLRLGRLVSPIVRGHHERWDGRGYPDGLAREEIPLGARIVSVVDAFDAMTHDRPYRKALSLDEAREELVRCAGAQFDPELVELLLTSEVAPARPEATLVRGLYASVGAELVS